MTRPVPTRVLHMTRIERIPSIIAHGLLSDTACRHAQIGGIAIGYDHIKQRRAQRAVPCGAGGTLADYVPFYFAPRSPMLFAVTRGNVSAEAARTDQIVYLVTTTQNLRTAGLTVVVSNRHAELGFADFTEQDELLNTGFVDWTVMRATIWTNTPADPDRKERRQAECLVHPWVPWMLFEQVATKTDEAKGRVEHLLGRLGQSTPVAVRRGWYF